MEAVETMGETHAGLTKVRTQEARASRNRQAYQEPSGVLDRDSEGIILI